VDHDTTPGATTQQETAAVVDRNMKAEKSVDASGLSRGRN
jgi:hypothetical protein